MDLEKDEFDFLEKDVLRRRPHLPEYDRREAEGGRLYQAPNCAPKRKRAAPRKKSSLNPTQKAPVGRLIKPPNCSSTRNVVAEEHELNRGKLLLKAPKRMLPRGFGVFKDFKVGLPVYIPFEFASGYALFHARGYDDQVGINFESTEEYIKLSDQVFTLIAFYPFESASDALFQMNSVSASIVTKQMRSLLVNNLPKPNPKDSEYYIAALETSVGLATKMPTECSNKTIDIIRGLRMNICKYIDGLQPADLEKSQRELAINYSRQRLKTTHKGNSMVAVSRSSSNDDVVVVPHRIEGVFIAMGKNEAVICTKNLVPGEAVYGEELISVKDEKGTEVEYRVWNPLKSKLGAAILSGISNIWVKPGSRVLCLGDVCGSTVSHLSDLVGPSGLVYAVALSVVALNMAEKRSNVTPIFAEMGLEEYRMLLSMVDVIFGDTYHPEMVMFVSAHCRFYLKTGGHYLISTQANGVDSSSQDEPMFVKHYGGEQRRQHKIVELIKLTQIDEEDVYMAVGAFRILVDDK